MHVSLSNGQSLNVRTRGDGGPDVLLLHGWVVSSEVWQPILERWPLQGAGRLLAVDFRGTGFSSKPVAGYKPEDHESDVSQLIDALSLQSVLLVGHSMGGLIAQRLALSRADAIARLMLLCPVPASGVLMDEGQIGYLHSLGGTEAGIRQVVTMLMRSAQDSPAVDRLVLAAAATTAGAFHEAFDSWRQSSFGERLEEIAIPTFVVSAAGDPALPPAFIRSSVVERLRDVSSLELPDCGHYPQFEAPDRVVELLLSQVEMLRASG